MSSINPLVFAYPPFISFSYSSHSLMVCHLHMSRNMHCAVGTLHTGTCQSNLFHAGSVVTALHLCFCLAALTSSRLVKWSKNKVREGTASVWRDTRGLPASQTSVCVCVCADRVLLWPLSSDVLMLNLTESGSPAGPHPSTHSKNSPA